MSFSSETKEELCRISLAKSCCALAEAYGVLLYCHTFDRREIRIITANDAFVQRLPKLFRQLRDDVADGEATEWTSQLIADEEAVLTTIPGLPIAQRCKKTP